MEPEPALHNAYQALAARFAAHFPTRLQGPRTIGREAEFPVVDHAGRAVDIAQLWPLLRSSAPQLPLPTDLLKVKRDAVNSDLIVGLDGPSYSYALEVGKGTIELNIGPCHTLFELEDTFRAALRRLVQAAALLGWRVLAYGAQPRTPPTRRLLSPKQRYHALADIMGADWIWYTVTASDQAHVDICRDEAVAVLNFANLMAPVVVALCANSPIVAGRQTGGCSGREIRMIDAPYGYRHGMIDRPYADFTDFVARLSRLPALLRRHGERLQPDGRAFSNILRADYGLAADPCPPISDECFDAFLLHDHYIWHSARLRSAYATVELRPACQQPPHQLMAAAALYLALVEARHEIEEYVQSALAPAPARSLAACWPPMQQYHRQVVRHGLDSPAPAPAFLAEILALAQAALARRGHGEERMIAPLQLRLAQKENPAQRAKRVFAQHGLEGLLDASAILPLHPV